MKLVAPNALRSPRVAIWPQLATGAVTCHAFPRRQITAVKGNYNMLIP